MHSKDNETTCENVPLPIMCWAPVEHTRIVTILSNNRNLTVVNLSVFLEHQQF